MVPSPSQNLRKHASSGDPAASRRVSVWIFFARGSLCLSTHVDVLLRPEVFFVIMGGPLFMFFGGVAVLLLGTWPMRVPRP